MTRKPQGDALTKIKKKKLEEMDEIEFSIWWLKSATGNGYHETCFSAAEKYQAALRVAQAVANGKITRQVVRDARWVLGKDE